MRVALDRIGDARREVILTPDEAGRAALAQRLGLPGLPALTCRFVLWRERSGRVIAAGSLHARLIQDDVVTLDPFETALTETFTLRFVPLEDLDDTIDPDDPIDEIGYDGATIDLAEAMAEQLALVLDPYPRRPAVG